MGAKPDHNHRQCRLCLDHLKQLLPIFGQAGCDRNIAQLLEAHLHVQVNEDQPLPKYICLSCLETVEAFDKFYLNVAQNQSFLMRNGALATVTILVRNDKHVEQEDGVNHGGTAIAESITRNDSLMLQGAPKNDFIVNPPSYDEAQQNKRVQITPSVTNVQPTSQTLADEHCYLQKVNEKSSPTAGEEVLTLKNNVILEEAASDNDDNVSEWEIDGNGGLACTGDDASFLVKVNKFKFPKMIVDGRLVVKGEELDKCIQEFYGLTCDLCKENMATLETLSDHFQKAHNVKNGYVVCCGRKIEKRAILVMHMAKHLQPEAFECHICKKMMTSPKILRFHVRNHLPEEQRPLKCDLCPRRFSYVSTLLTHVASHQAVNKSSRMYHFCETCGRAYCTRSRLTAHILELHTNYANSQSIRCNICNKQFTSKYNLSYHMTTHEPNLHQEKCNQCNKWLKNKICLRKHMLQHSNMRYQCSSCEYSTTNGQSMQNHLRVQHTDDKPYVCPECGKAFKLRSNLRNHMPQHTGERKFTCEFCLRQFLSSSNYYSHRKRMHSKEMEQQRKQKELNDSEIRSKLKKQ